ncbi:hypothetical protein ONR75_30820 [Rhodopseudomonas sp. P2A-2r]|uniref:hypothetical protein n=1 Tax=Rhodopseudomonas sp. P2A-2r TaxID=2991972 RepID=UPI00223458AF|nr:hypothetical protein [Rhodopseudomonas sp. P2A-2r]UZE49052.1 hypothetical protein ONR75_30820 [Rhodopseudomonas sp. P2A-2r]
MGIEYSFRIDSDMTPETFPMERLADYLSALAKLLGQTPNVHFEAVRPGSSILVARVEDQSVEVVSDRVRNVHAGVGPREALKAYGNLDMLLRQDRATGTLTSDVLGVVIPFPGINRPEPLVFGPYWQDGSLDGEVIRVGGSGKDDTTVPVHLREAGIVHTHLNTTYELSKEIAKFYGGQSIRVHGKGQWFRGSDGVWELREFKIASFEALGDAPLSEVVRNIRSAGGGEWSSISDPVGYLMEQRADDEGDQ